MKEENFGLALLLAKKAGLFGKTFLSTSQLAALTGFSQQSISRKLREMEGEGIVHRSASTSGTEISFTKKGRLELESFHSELAELFSKRSASIKGKVAEGMGEGTYYTSLPQYRKQFRQVFGHEIFPGTLNIEINPEDKSVLTSSKPILIEGFKTKQRTFGGIDCWPCLVNGKENALMIQPHRSSHNDNIVEVVASSGLRKKFGLANGSEVELVRR